MTRSDFHLCFTRVSPSFRKTLTMVAPAPTQYVQFFGRKKTTVAVTHCKRGNDLIKINGCPIELVEPEILQFKAYETILLLGRHRFAGVDMRVRVKGGGHTSQIYAIVRALQRRWLRSTRSTSMSRLKKR
ncbi:hypothetical protein QQ045_007907 [Rhodiola kirilowii]